MGRTVKTMLFVSIFGMLGSAATRRVLAETAAVDMPWFAQFGLCGVFASLLWWALAKTLPRLSEDNKEAARIVASEAKESAVQSAKIHAEALSQLCGKLDDVVMETRGTTAEIRAGNDSQLALLRSVINNQHKGMGS
jgi:hypothetical protein